MREVGQKTIGWLGGESEEGYSATEYQAQLTQTVDLRKQYRRMFKQFGGTFNPLADVVGSRGSKVADPGDTLRSDPMEAKGASVSGGKRLTPQIAAKFLRKAGGDRKLAKQLAAQEGYTE